MSCQFPRRVSVAPFGADKGDVDLLQDSIPCGGLCLQHHPNLSQWPNWIHALRKKSCECACHSHISHNSTTGLM